VVQVWWICGGTVCEVSDEWVFSLLLCVGANGGVVLSSLVCWCVVSVVNLMVHGKVSNGSLWLRGGDFVLLYPGGGLGQ